MTPVAFARASSRVCIPAGVRETALLVREALDALGMPVFAKTTGSSGIHLYVSIVRGPLQKQLWTFAKELAWVMESRAPKLVTAEYRGRFDLETLL